MIRLSSALKFWHKLSKKIERRDFSETINEDVRTKLFNVCNIYLNNPNIMEEFRSYIIKDTKNLESLYEENVCELYTHVTIND